jgi:putative RecB family exonuclease
MAFPLPTSLSPSKVASFKDCALAFRFSAIDRVPEPPTIWTAKGTLVHRALELLFELEPHQRTIEAALDCLSTATPEVLGNDEYKELTFATAEEEAAFHADSELLVHKYFRLEDPTKIRPIGLEMKLEVDVGSLRMRGIIDRLDEDEHGNLIVVDYKTGKVPRINHEASKLGGVHFYAFLCEKVLGRRPTQVQLLYLAEPLRIVTEPTDQSIRGLQIRTSAIWTAVEKACDREDFRPKPSRLCDWCSYKAWCPAFGGDPAMAPKREVNLPATSSAIDAASMSTVQDLEVQLDSGESVPAVALT